MSMKYKALISFSGLISMSKDDIAEINDNEISADLIKAGYIEPAEEKNESKRVRSKSNM